MRADNQVTTTSAPSIEVAPELDRLDQKPIPSKLKEIVNHDGNLCEMFNDNELAEHYSRVNSGIDDDRNSMERYLKKYESAIRRAKLIPEHDKKNFPFKDASNVVMPYLFDAALDFNARAAPALLERSDICYIKVNGKDEHELSPEMQQELQVIQQQDPEQAAQIMQQIQERFDSTPPPKQARGERVAKMINFDLTEGMPEWRAQTDKAIMLLPIAGMFFRKTFQCPVENRRKSELVYPDKMIYNHHADTFDGCPRKSFEFSMPRNDVITAVRSGQFKGWEGLEDDMERQEYQFTESHCTMDLDGDGYAEPYIVIIGEDAGCFLSVVPRFSEEDVEVNKDGEVVRIKGEEFFTQTIFIPDPAGSCTGLGFGILADDMYKVIDTNTNQMVDAGTLNNIAANTGFIRQGSRVGPRAGNRQKKGTIDMTMGKFTTWESDGTSPLSNDIAQLPFAGPSQPLMALLEALKLELREMTTVGQGIEPNANEAASMYLARLHQALIRPTSTMVRVMNGLTKEFKRIYDIQKRYLTDEEYVNILDEQASVEADYSTEGNDIRPTADPSQGSEMERVARAEAELDKAMQLPQVFNLRYAAQEYSDAIGADTEKYVPMPEPGQPDPIDMIIAQAQQTMSEAEKMKATADIMDAQAKMAEVNLKYMKIDMEIEKMESEVLKNLSEVDKNQAEVENSKDRVYLDALKAQRESLQQQRDNLKEILNAAEIGAGRLAQTPRNQNVSGSSGTGM